MLICHLLIQPVPKFQESHTPQLAEINNQRNILYFLLVHNTFLRKNSQDWVLTCTLQDDGVLGEKRTAPLQQADLVMLGLGVIDLETHNEALLLKNLHKFFNKSDIPWVNLFWEKHYRNGKLPSHIKDDSFWWRDIPKLLDAFKRMAMVNIQNGASCLFWV